MMKETSEWTSAADAKQKSGSYFSWMSSSNAKSTINSIARVYDVVSATAVVGMIATTLATANPALLGYFSYALLADICIYKSLRYNVNGALRGRIAADTFYLLASMVALNMFASNPVACVFICAGLLLTGKFLETQFLSSSPTVTPGLFTSGRMTPYTPFL